MVKSQKKLLCCGGKVGTKRRLAGSDRQVRLAMASAVHTMLREVMDMRQASEYLGISSDTLYRYASEGLIPAFKLGNRWKFKRSLLDTWMAEQSGSGGKISVMGKRKPVGRAR